MNASDMGMHRISIRSALFIGLIIIAFFALALFVMGQPMICTCGFVKLWHGPVVLTSENSQHISDWYTFSHIIHGFAFYGITWLVGRKRGWSVGWMLVLAIFAETSWELFENTDFIINRYRSVTISYDYFGDSVINSVSDVLFMVGGFLLAWRLPVSVIIALTVLLEVFVGYYIRDNLTLNIIMLLYPFETILKWQKGG